MNSIQTETRRCPCRLKPLWAAAVLLAMICSPGLLLADWTVTQTIQLKTGWNAVYLEASPADPKPDAVFNGIPADKVLVYIPQNSSVQYIQNPDEIEFNKSGWHLWVPKTKPEFFLNTLFSLQANRPYLIRCTQDFLWTVTGTPQTRVAVMQPDSFNFTGFHVATSNPPTFASYFSGIKAYTDTYIYFLRNGAWIRAAKSEPIADGQAYWVFCKGVTDFVTPLAVKLPSPGDLLSFGSMDSELVIVISNRSDTSLSFTLEQVPNAAGDQAVPLSLVQSDPLTGKTFTPFSAYSPSTNLESGAEASIRLAVRRTEITGNQAKSLLKLTDNAGGRLYIPVLAEKVQN